MLPLYIFEPKYRRLLAQCLQGNRLFAVAMKKPGCSREMPCKVAGLGMVRVAVRNEDGTYRLALQGLSRIELGKAIAYRPYRRHRFEVIASDNREIPGLAQLMQQILGLVKIRLEQGSAISIEILKELASEEPGRQGSKRQRQSLEEVLTKMAGAVDPEQLVDLVSCTLLSVPRERQRMLEVVDTEMRLNSLIRFLSAEVARNA